MMRRVRYPFDRRIYQEAHGWASDKPTWFQILDEAPFWKFVNRHGIDIAIWDDELVGLLQLDETEPDIFEMRLSAKRGANPDLIVEAGCSLKGLFEIGVKELYVWIFKKNLAVIKICEACGMQKDGVTMFKRAVFGTPAEWLRLSYTKTMWEAENEGSLNTSEHLLIPDSA